MTTEIQKYHDYLLEDHETLIPPIFMDGYIETDKKSSFQDFIKNTPTIVKASLFAISYTALGILTTWIGIQR